MITPELGKPLLLYLSIIGDVVVSMLAQEDDDKNERVVYYLSKRFHDYETRYTPIEKSCFTLTWVVLKLRHIILPFQILIVARMDPLKYLFEKLALSGRLSGWLILLVEFDLKYCRHRILHHLRFGPPFLNDAQTLRPKASLEPY